MRIQITRNCHCEHDAHEIGSYYRKGLTLQKFKVGDELEVEKEWNNFYGAYYRCTTKKGYADIAVRNASKIAT